MREPVLKVEHLKKYYPIRKGAFSREKAVVRACDDVSFELYAGETLGIVGESGCGKTTTIQSVIRLIEPTDGRIWLNGQDFRTMKGEELKRARQKLKLIFQDPYSSLNPRMTVKEIVSEPLEIAGACKDKAERDRRVLETMEQVGLDPSYQDRYPHEFSGGQRQRIGIARAIVLRPDVVICDEPVSALDVSIQAKIINLLRRFQRERELAYIFISHDLGVVRHIAHRVLVMYLGCVVEEGESRELFAHPLHPYTRALLDSVPRMDSDGRPAAALQGDVPSPADPPSGCLFHTRCPYAREVCAKQAPELRELKSGHKCACHFPGAHEKEEEQP
ncbi:MAG: dipeptide ABC transporter ATP-binding protein [Oscillospiraceae bacterium]|nr:dipeptide ABC transporter ATP-binding protein [Oscillospiraceae bacterium]